MSAFLPIADILLTPLVRAHGLDILNPARRGVGQQYVSVRHFIILFLLICLNPAGPTNRSIRLRDV